MIQLYSGFYLSEHVTFVCKFLWAIFIQKVQGLWKTKNQNMAELCKQAKELKEKFISFQIDHVMRVCTDNFFMIWSCVYLFFPFLSGAAVNLIGLLPFSFPGVEYWGWCASKPSSKSQGWERFGYFLFFIFYSIFFPESLVFMVCGMWMWAIHSLFKNWLEIVNGQMDKLKWIVRRSNSFLSVAEIDWIQDWWLCWEFWHAKSFGSNI